ncbi:glycosyltransferase family 2 protein [Synechocystis sp. LKSZ1]|uniref:glycosyltransferase family 2 protein n=1 Tax=Synechocystis sp. LKSZ1 TaxID=3144951 RepID=UPI00336BD010
MLAPKKNTYIIIPVHNRKLVTTNCLNNLKRNGDLDIYQVIIIDDGSTDGTSEFIKSEYPKVILLQGDGNLWWTGAIRMGMEYAYEQSANYFIWLNDDCYPQKGTIDKLLFFCHQDPDLIIGSQCIDSSTLEPSYAGISTKRKYFKAIHCQSKSIIECDALNGNLVCFSRNLIDKIGYPDNKIFPHHLGDFVYTNNALKNGFKLYIHGGAISFCSQNPQNASWLYSKKSFKQYWHDFFLQTSPSYWKIQVSAYESVFGKIGFLYYFYHGFIKFIIIFFILRPLPIKFKQIFKS